MRRNKSNHRAGGNGRRSRRSRASTLQSRSLSSFRPLLEQLEDRLLLVANPIISLPTNVAAIQGGLVAVPVLVNTLSDGGSNSGMSSANIAVNFDPNVFTVANSDLFLGTAEVSAGSVFNITSTINSGQMNIALNPISTPSISTVVGKRDQSHYCHNQLESS